MPLHYPHIIMACAGEIFALQHEKLEQIVAFLMVKAKGGTIDAEDLARVTQRQEREVAQSSGDIAVIPVYGVLAQRMNMMMEFSGGTSMQQLGGIFRAAINDSNIKAIVFDHNSPGGTAAGTEELATEIMQSRGVKPIIAQINSLSASGSYWLASAADEIVVTPGGEGGSIGVYRVHDDLTKMLENEGIKRDIIRSAQSPFKIEDSGYEPLSPGARDHLQARVDQTYDRMIRSIAAARSKTLTTVREGFGQGRVFGAEELLSRGMADRIDTLEATLERFGSGPFNPVANAAKQEKTSSAEAVDVLVAKMKAGDLPSPRELENGLKGLAGLSNKEAERFVSRWVKGSAQGDPERPTKSAVSVTDLAELREGLADIRQRLGA
jgi:signal peptide peptidase SppA